MSKKESNYPPENILNEGRNDKPPNKPSGQKKRPKFPPPPPPPPKHP